MSGRLAHWESTPSSLVALVILLDQFPRSFNAGQKTMFEGDEMARAVVLRAIFQTNIMDEIHPVSPAPVFSCRSQDRLKCWCGLLESHH